MWTAAVDPVRDIETINLELIFSDLEILERRIAKTARGRHGTTRRLQRSWIFCKPLKAHLEDGKLAITYDTDDEDEQAWIGSVQSAHLAKPVIFAANVSRG